MDNDRIHQKPYGISGTYDNIPDSPVSFKNDVRLPNELIKTYGYNINLFKLASLELHKLYEGGKLKYIINMQAYSFPIYKGAR